MAHITVETWIHRYPAAELWEPNGNYIQDDPSQQGER